MNPSADIPDINEADIATTLEQNARPDAKRVRDALARASEMKGLHMDDVAVLATISDPDQLGELFATASRVKDTIYGRRLVLFAPLRYGRAGVDSRSPNKFTMSWGAGAPKKNNDPLKS